MRRIRAGGVNAKPNIRVVSDRPSAALIDGDNAMGHLVMRRAAHLAIEKAKATGIGWVGARMSNHAGPAALYVTLPLHHDMIGLYFAVGSNNHLPPWGGSESLLGTNPMAVAVPAQDEPPIVLDMAPTVAAYGKVRLKAQRGEPMPVGWMIDHEGKPLTDPKRADEGHLLPIGDYKGYGLSLIIGILAGALNRAALGRDVIDFVKETGKATNTGHAIAAIEIEAFMPAAEFKHAVDEVIRDIRNSQAPARRRTHLSAGRTEPRQASRPPRPRHPDAEVAARQSRRRGARPQHRAAGIAPSGGALKAKKKALRYRIRVSKSNASPNTRRRHRRRADGRGLRPPPGRRGIWRDRIRRRSGAQRTA